MTFRINDMIIDELVSLEVVRKARNVKKRYNANGDLLIDSAPRKYGLTAYIWLSDYYRLYDVFHNMTGTFVSVKFESPFEGTVTRNFFLAEEPCETSHTAGSLVYYKVIKLVFEEE